MSWFGEYHDDVVLIGGFLLVIIGLVLAVYIMSVVAYDPCLASRAEEYCAVKGCVFEGVSWLDRRIFLVRDSERAVDSSKVFFSDGELASCGFVVDKSGFVRRVE